MSSTTVWQFCVLFFEDILICLCKVRYDLKINYLLNPYLSLTDFRTIPLQELLRLQREWHDIHNVHLSDVQPAWWHALLLWTRRPTEMLPLQRWVSLHNYIYSLFSHTQWVSVTSDHHVSIVVIVDVIVVVMNILLYRF